MLWSAFCLKHVTLQIIQISFSSNGDWKESIRQRNVSFTRLNLAKWRTTFTSFYMFLQINFIVITLGHGCSAVNFLHIFRTLFYKNTYKRLLLFFCFIKQIILFSEENLTVLVQKAKPSMKIFFGKLRICLHLIKTSLMKKFIYCVVVVLR